jgi:hypothetical protein
MPYHDPRFKQEGREAGAFLSGNTPLVTVLREALAPDEANRTGNTPSAAKHSVRAEIQGLMTYLEEYLKHHRARTWIEWRPSRDGIGQRHRPKRVEVELSAGLGVGGYAAWVVVSHAGDKPRPDPRQGVLVKAAPKDLKGVHALRVH